MKACGVLPMTLRDADDDVLDAQCSADSQVANTAAMLERFAHIFVCGLEDDDLRFLYRHTCLEHRWNKAQVPRLRRVRDELTGCTEVLEDYRLRLKK